jgi:hypothetical protein
MFAALFAASAWSATDVIYLKNGDKITGAIAKIWDAEIYIEPDYADEFTVDIEAIDYIESDRDFELRISMKEDKPIRFVGKSPEGEQLIERDGEVRAVLLASLAEVEEPEDYLDWSVKGSVGLDFERGNTDTDQSEVRGEGFLKLGDHRHFLTGAILRERANNDSTKRQDRVDYNYNWSFSRPWFLGLNGNYERDPIRDLDYRYIAGITLGRDIWDSARRFWSIQAGPGVQVQEQSGESDTQGILQYSQRITHKFFSSDMDAFHRHSVTHNLNGRDNTVIRTSTGFEWEFIDDAFWRISYDYDWEENPADDAVAKDERLSFGVGIEFD